MLQCFFMCRVVLSIMEITSIQIRCPPYLGIHTMPTTCDAWTAINYYDLVPCFGGDHANNAINNNIFT